MTDLAGKPFAAMNGPVDHEGPADSGSEGHEQDVAVVLSRAELHLGPGRGVGVVVDHHRNAEGPL